MNTKTKTCFDCEKEYSLSDHYSNQCPECRAAEKVRRLAESRERNRQRLDGEIPALFRKTDTNHPNFNAAAWSKISEHRFSESKPWLGLVGTTGRCKTRLAYLYAVDEIMRLATIHGEERELLPSFEFVASYQIGDAVLAQYSNDYEIKNPAKDLLARIRRCDVLLIDDIGKGRLSPAIAAELFALIDYRHVHLLRTIWTSNSTPEVIAAGLDDDMAGPFAGRLIEMSKTYTFK